MPNTQRLDLLEHLKALCAAPGLSSYETPVRETITATWGALVDEMGEDRLGSLWAVRRGDGAAPRPKVMLAAHMDAIGLMVTRVHKGFLEVTKVGGIDERVLPGALVEVHPGSGASQSSAPLPGVVVRKPPDLQSTDKKDRVTPISRLIIDVGFTADEVARRVSIGDLVTFVQPPTQLNDDWLLAKSLDNRACVAAVSACLEQLQNRSHQWDVVAVATVQEEVSMGGAAGSAFGLRPDIALVIDTTFAKQPGLPDWQTFALGEGPTLMYGPNLHPKLYAEFRQIAQQYEIPFHQEIAPHRSGTDAYAVQVSREGIPTACLSIPIKHMHTPVEVVSLKDITRAARLITEFIVNLDGDFLKRLQLDV